MTKLPYSPWFYLALALVIGVAACACFLTPGCAGKTVSGLAPASTADGTARADVTGDNNTTTTKQQTNDPVVGWILAAGAVLSPPACFLLYMVSKRTRMHGWLTGASASTRKANPVPAQAQRTGPAQEIVNKVLAGVGAKPP